MYTELIVYISVYVGCVCGHSYVTHIVRWASDVTHANYNHVHVAHVNIYDSSSSCAFSAYPMDIDKFYIESRFAAGLYGFKDVKPVCHGISIQL